MESIKSKIAKAYQKSLEFESEHGGCAQATIKALLETYRIFDKNSFHSLGIFNGGGGGQCDGQCGAYSAGLFFLGTKYSRYLEDIYNNKEKAMSDEEKACKLAKDLHDRFIKEFCSVTCSQIQKKLYGRQYNFLDYKQMTEFIEDGGHDPNKKSCPFVCASAAKWTVEIYENFESNRQETK